MQDHLILESTLVNTSESQAMMKYGHGKNSQFTQIIIIIIASLAGISYGMLFSWTSPAIPDLVSDVSLNITLEEASYLTVIPPILTVLAAPMYSLLVNVLGRQKSAILVGIPYFISWVIIGLADSIHVFYMSRILSGIGDAGLFTVLPLYICEVSEPLVRGTWGNLMAIFIAAGKCLINIVGSYTTIKNTALIGGGITLLNIVLVIFIPESPYYLIIKNREDDAKRSLSFLRWRSDIDDEFIQLKADVKRQISESSTYKDLFIIDRNRKPLLVCMGLRIAQQYSGLVAFESYTQYMFQEADISTISEKISSIIFSFMFVPVISIVAFFSDRFGRRQLSITSSASCAIILSAVTIYFGIQQYSYVDLQQFSWVPLVGLVMYVCACSVGLAFMPFLLAGELFSSSVKAKASGVITINTAVHTIIVPKLFQTLTSNFGVFTPFALFSCCTILGTIFCYLYIPETRGKTLEEIQQDLINNKCIGLKSTQKSQGKASSATRNSA